MNDDLTVPKPKMLAAHDILEMTVLGETVFVHVLDVTNEKSFRFKVANYSETMIGSYHAERCDGGGVYFHDYKGFDRKVTHHPATYKVLTRVHPSTMPDYNGAYKRLVELLMVRPVAAAAPITRTEIDGDVYLVQSSLKEFTKDNPKLHFGPLSTRLSDLMAEGFDLTVLGYRSHRRSERRVTLYLTRKGEQYKICRKFMYEFEASPDLSEFVKEQNLTHKLNLNVEYRELPFTPPVVEERDPYDVLLERYPYVDKPKEDIMCGNRTLHQAINDAIGDSMEKLY